MFNFFKKEKIVSMFVSYSEETAKINPGMILREYNRLIDIEESKLIWKFPEECYLSFEIERDFIGEVKESEKFYLLERIHVEEIGYKKPCIVINKKYIKGILTPEVLMAAVNKRQEIVNKNNEIKDRVSLIKKEKREFEVKYLSR